MVTGIAVVLVAVAVTANDVVVAVLSTNNARSLRRWQWQQQDGVSSLCQQTARSSSKSCGSNGLAATKYYHGYSAAIESET